MFTKMESSKVSCVFCFSLQKQDLSLQVSCPSQSRAVKGTNPITLAQILTFYALSPLSRLLRLQQMERAPIF